MDGVGKRSALAKYPAQSLVAAAGDKVRQVATVGRNGGIVEQIDFLFVVGRSRGFPFYHRLELAALGSGRLGRNGTLRP